MGILDGMMKKQPTEEELQAKEDLMMKSSEEKYEEDARRQNEEVREQRAGPQSADRTMRPPSMGKPGTRLKRMSKSDFLIRARMGRVWRPSGTDPRDLRLRAPPRMLDPRMERLLPGRRVRRNYSHSDCVDFIILTRKCQTRMDRVQNLKN